MAPPPLSAFPGDDPPCRNRATMSSSGALLDDARALRDLGARVLADVEKLRPPAVGAGIAAAGAAVGGGEPVTEEALVACKDALSSAKHQLIDLQTRKSLAAALASDRPFAALDANAAAACTCQRQRLRCKRREGARKGGISPCATRKYPKADHFYHPPLFCPRCAAAAYASARAGVRAQKEAREAAVSRTVRLRERGRLLRCAL